MTRYFKIKVGKRHPFVKVTSEPRLNLDGVPLFTGLRVTSEGDEYEIPNATGVTHEIIMFAANNVVGEYVMSNHYASLVRK